MGVFADQSEGTLRVRRHDNGDMDVWVKGWRLEIRFLFLIPAMLAVGFALSSIFLPFRILFSAGLLGVAFFVHRLTQVGIRMSATGLTFNDLVRTRQIPWEDVVTYMGERTRHDGKLVLLQRDGSTVPAPGSLTGEDMNPIGDEGDLSVVEELNRLTERYRQVIPPDAGTETPEPRRRVRAKGPTTRPRAIEAIEAPPPVPQTWVPQGDVAAPAPAPSASLPPALRHPHVPRPPKPEPEPEPTGRGRRARRKRAAEAAPLIQVPDAEAMSPGARRLASLEDRDR
jgi:hypothetical protein